MTEFEKYLGQTLTIQIDRLLSSRHPEHGFIYPLSYGYLPGLH
jgi:inorganic pyrophosphatase